MGFHVSAEIESKQLPHNTNVHNIVPSLCIWLVVMFAPFIRTFFSHISQNLLKYLIYSPEDRMPCIWYAHYALRSRRASTTVACKLQIRQ